MVDHFVAEQTDAGLDFDITLDKDKRVYSRFLFFSEKQKPRMLYW